MCSVAATPAPPQARAHTIRLKSAPLPDRVLLPVCHSQARGAPCHRRTRSVSLAVASSSITLAGSVVPGAPGNAYQCWLAEVCASEQSRSRPSMGSHPWRRAQRSCSLAAFGSARSHLRATAAAGADHMVKTKRHSRHRASSTQSRSLPPHTPSALSVVWLTAGIRS